MARKQLGAAPANDLDLVAKGYVDTKTQEVVNTAVTGMVTASATQTLTNKDLSSGTNTFPTSLATLTGTQTLTNKDISSATNTLPTSTVTVTGTQSLSNKTLTTPTISGYTESVTTVGTVTTSATLNISAGTVLTATLTASTACTFTMPTAAAGKSFVLMLKQAASTGGGTATFSGVKWPTAGAPTITATAGKMDIISFFSDGTNWYGSASQGYTP